MIAAKKLGVKGSFLWVFGIGTLAVVGILLLSYYISCPPETAVRQRHSILAGFLAYLYQGKLPVDLEGLEEPILRHLKTWDPRKEPPRNSYVLMYHVTYADEKRDWVLIVEGPQRRFDCGTSVLWNDGQCEAKDMDVAQWVKDAHVKHYILDKWP